MTRRDYKKFGEGEYFHVYNRGNNLQDIFLDDDDYDFFLLKLSQNIFPDVFLQRMRTLPVHSFLLSSYCLMSNHFHLLLRQNKEFTIQQLMLRVCGSYSKYFNKKYNRVGRLFQDRFKQVHATDGDQLLWLHAYINLNPVIDNVVEDIETYRWTSYSEIVSNEKGLCNTDFIFSRLKNEMAVKAYYNQVLPMMRINKKMRKFWLA